MEAQQMFEIALAAIKLAETVEEWFETSGAVGDFYVVEEALEEYQHARDRA